MRKKFNQIPKHKPIFSATFSPTSALVITTKLQHGIALHNSGLLEQARGIYEEVLKLNPTHFDALLLSGTVSAQTKQLDKALKLFNDASKVDPTNAYVYNNRGNVLKELKRLEEALSSYDKAIELKSGYADAYYNRGVVLQELNRLGEALSSYDKAVESKSDFVEAYNNRGNVFKKLRLLDEALSSYDKAIELKSNFAETYNDRGAVLRELKRLDEAIASYDRAIELKSNYCEAYYNRGNTLKELNRFDEALDSYDRAIELKHDYAEAYSNRGIVFHERKQFETAISSYDRAIELKSDYAQPYWNKSLTLLLNGDFDLGWQLYEWRWKQEEMARNTRDFKEPLWLGLENIANKTLLLHAEQGLGDTLQFSRYTKLVADLGALVILEVQKPLAELLQNLEGVSQFVVKGCTLPEFDFHCPLMSLPLAFKTTQASIPKPSPHLVAKASTCEAWAQRLGPKGKPRVGLVWSGNTKHKNDQNRSLTLQELLPHLSRNCDYVSLQKEVRAVDKEALKGSGIRHYGEELKDFSQTAALCELMDLVISVDTSVAHLAGALNKPTWILLPYVPDWRWLLNREDSPWYSSVKLYRQNENRAWEEVLSKVAIDLQDFTQ